MNAPANEPHDESDLLFDALSALPLMDDLFLRMQAQNIAMVNAHIIEIEQQMYRQYIEHGRTPIPEALFTSALSQMWIFGLYELFRTWRQRVRELLTHSEDVAAGQAQATVIPQNPDHTVNLPFLYAKARAEWDEAFIEKVRVAQEALESAFRELEGIRVTLAKHEIPKKGVKAADAGYARIDPVSGSMTYQYIDRKGYSNMASRHSIVQHILHALGVAYDVT